MRHPGPKRSKTNQHQSSAQARALQGVRVGHASDLRDLTGCTVVLAEGGAVCGVDVRGSASSTRELAPCIPGHVVDRIHGVFLTGGSAFGLDAAAGVMRFLESEGIGFPTGAARVPIVPAAVIYDLAVGSAKARPDAKMAAQACRSASSKITEGSVGAGTGATVGKLFGIRCATKGGIGFRQITLAGKVAVQALVVVNAFGDVVDPATGRVIAGARKGTRSGEFADSLQEMIKGSFRKSFGAAHTTLAVVMTDAALDKVQATKVAQMAQDGIARAISPTHTIYDGDLVFALSVGKKRADLNTVGAAAAEATAQAIVSAVLNAESLGGIPACKDFAQPSGQ
ncbi:MAG: P1 family peptidase [Acidobacteriota bacterium]